MAFAIVAAACGSDSSESADTTPVATEVAGEPEPEPPATDAPEPEPEPTDPPEPEPTDPPAHRTLPRPRRPPNRPPPLNAVGLVPLPGAQLDFTGTAVPNPSLVWSLYSGSGGIVVENVGGPLPPGCHGTSFFDPRPSTCCRSTASTLEAYATRGEGGCDGMQQDCEGRRRRRRGEDQRRRPDPVRLRRAAGDPFDVSTQVVNPDGQDGVFRLGRPGSRCSTTASTTPTSPT